jgi:hypothetical protein
MVIDILLSYLYNNNLLVRSHSFIKICIVLVSLFMFFVNDKSRLIRDIRHREEILAEQELWTEATD